MWCNYGYFGLYCIGIEGVVIDVYIFDIGDVVVCIGG